MKHNSLIREYKRNLLVIKNLPRLRVQRFSKEKIAKTKLGALNPQSKKVAQYSKDGKKLNEFNTIREAVESTNGSESGISKNINGKSKSSGGFVWKEI